MILLLIVLEIYIRRFNICKKKKRNIKILNNYFIFNFLIKIY